MALYAPKHRRSYKEVSQALTKDLLAYQAAVGTGLIPAVEKAHAAMVAFVRTWDDGMGVIGLAD